MAPFDDCVGGENRMAFDGRCIPGVIVERPLYFLILLLSIFALKRPKKRDGDRIELLFTSTDRADEHTAQIIKT